jgi:hypothetical protein
MKHEVSLPCSQEPATDPYLSQMNPVHTISLRFILILSYHLSLGLSSGFFPPGFPIKIFYSLLISPMHATCPAHLIHNSFTATVTKAQKIRIYSGTTSWSSFKKKNNNNEKFYN